MNELVETGLQDNLFAPPPMQEFFQRCDLLFFKAFQHFRMINGVQSLYSMARVVMCLVLVMVELWAESMPFSMAVLWCLLLAPVSLLQFGAYRLMARATNNLSSFLLLAETLEHVEFVSRSNLLPEQHAPVTIETSVNREIFDFNNQEVDPDHDDKKINIMAVQIKYQAQQLNIPLLITARLSFALYQALHFWALYLFFWQLERPSWLLDKYMMVVLIIGTYQYVQIYVIAVVVAVFLPFYGIVRLVRLCLLRINSAKFIRTLKPKRFRPAEVKGQHECRVCLLAYNADDKIITLPCNEMHHFHSFCIQAWLKLSITCPMCRQSFLNIDRGQMEKLMAQLN